MFGGNWGKDGDKIFGEEGSINQNVFGLWNDDHTTRTDDMTFGNKVMQVLGMAAVGYTLHHRCQGRLQRWRLRHQRQAVISNP